MKKKYIISFILICILTITGIFYFQNRATYSIEPYEIETGGWGYLIKKNGKAVIKQYRIPGIQKNYAFTSEESAQKVGEHVLKKIEEQKMPSVKPTELIKMGIIDSLHRPIP